MGREGVVVSETTEIIFSATHADLGSVSKDSNLDNTRKVIVWAPQTFVPRLAQLQIQIVENRIMDLIVYYCRTLLSSLDIHFYSVDTSVLLTKIQQAIWKVKLRQAQVGIRSRHHRPSVVGTASPIAKCLCDRDHWTCNNYRRHVGDISTNNENNELESLNLHARHLWAQHAFIRTANDSFSMICLEIYRALSPAL